MKSLTRIASALFALLLLAGPVAAQGKRQGLKEACAELAESIKKAAEADNQQSVQIGTFIPLEPRDEDVGAAIGANLAQALGSFAQTKAVFVVNGKYAFVADEEDKAVTFVQITCEMVHVVNGRVQKRFPAVESLVKHVGSLATLTAPTGEIPQGGTSKDANKALGKILEKPTGAAKTVTIAQPHPKSHFGVEILCKPNGGKNAQPRTVDVSDGKPFVGIGRNEAYEVKVYNYGPHEAAFSLCIDGLDQFVFTKDRKPDGSPRFGHIILPAAKGGKPGEVTIAGWHERFDERASEHHYHEFLVTENGKGAISKFPKVSRGKVGVIEVQFCLSFPKGAMRNASETAQGQAGKTSGTVVERVIDPAHEFISVRYNRPAK
ncbi:MAG TPA: hypothetical protein VMZ71_11220 [Gemmataceae bacterium]|nr:hypothetical protein [Gemmataceae bacterium]